jgi:hypothetical protein
MVRRSLELIWRNDRALSARAGCPHGLESSLSTADRLARPGPISPSVSSRIGMAGVVAETNRQERRMFLAK